VIASRVVVYGDVQGVFFRDSCREQAEQAGVAGWVRNRSDGAVEAVFEGEPEAVARVCRWCESGPDQARVDHVAVTDEELADLTGFTVR